MSRAVVVGSGPNGLAGAVALAQAGLEVTVLEAAETIGGGTRTSELTVPGLLHDHCSAVHPMAVGSPFLSSLDLGRHGLDWAWPEVDLAHPLDDGSAGVLVQSIDATAEGLGDDGKRWKSIFGRPARGFEELNEDLVEPIVHLPKHPLRLTRFGIPAAMPATVLTRAFSGEHAKALFGGVASHSYAPLTKPMSSAVGMALTTVCHHNGWPVARGGSRSITDALGAELGELGGKIELGRAVTKLADLGDPEVVLYDLAPGAVAEIAGSRLPSRVERAYRRYEHGPGAFKIDFAVEGGIPWMNGACTRAGTVHVVGSFDELVHAEAEINKGRMPERPMILVGQQYLADPSRSAGNVHPIWAYAHVPARWEGDATELILDQIERFAPRTRERIRGEVVSRAPLGFEAYNANYVGGDIITGANNLRQLAFRPKIGLDPYSTGIPGHYICSAATPPGAGVHGMGGYNAARSALKSLGG